MKLLPVTCLLGAVLSSSPVSAGVVIEHAPNFVALSATADTSFDGSVIDAGVQGTDFAIAAPPGEPHPPYRNAITVSSTLLPSATSHPAKDQASGTVTLAFDPGGLGVADTFSVLFSGTASAMSALASDGSFAAARVDLRASVMFRLDSFSAPAGSFVGSLAIDALPAAVPFAGFSIAVVQDGVLDVAFFSAGDLGGAVPLYAGHGYQINAKYGMLVPHGVDPPFSVAITGSLVPAIPEPQSYALMLAGLGLVGWLARRRARAPATV